MRSSRSLFIYSTVIFLFAALMIYALRHDPHFTSSMLVGKPSPTFSAKTLDGKDFYTADLLKQKRFVIVNFWSTSCYVCREEAPELENFYRNVTLFSDTNPYLLSVNIEDDKASIMEWQKNYSQTFPVLQDTTGAISLNFGVTGTPETFFVDSNGIVRYRIAGEVNSALILNFITWLQAHPKATESEATDGLTAVRGKSE